MTTREEKRGEMMRNEKVITHSKLMEKTQRGLLN
jgi:hypothetical protein